MNTKFQDHLGRQWNLAFVESDVYRVLRRTNVSLSRLNSIGNVRNLITDPPRFAGVLNALLEPLQRAAGVDDTDLAAALDDDTGEKAHEIAIAFCFAVADFHKGAAGRKIREASVAFQQQRKEAKNGN